MSGKIVIIISEENDFSTDEVIEWLLSFGNIVYRLNVEDTIKLIGIDLQKEEISLSTTNHGDITISSKLIKSVWYRRGDLSIRYSKPSIQDEFMFLFNPIMEMVREEVNVMKELIYNLLTRGQSIGNFYTDHEVNKLLNLKHAKSCGIKTPDSFIVSTKQRLNEIKTMYEKVIIKPYTEGGLIISNHEYYTHDNTALLYDTTEYPDYFEPTLIQEYIEKKLELRIFYLKGSFYTSAIFSQLDEQTKIDFRNYNDKRPNRIVPYNLPEDIKTKLLDFLDQIAIDSGSIDMILTPDNNYYFLEINPVGQFHQISYPCNFYLEKLISEKLNA